LLVGAGVVSRSIRGYPMPFASFTLTTNEQADGRFLAHERNVDSDGEIYSYSYSAASEAEATATQAARYDAILPDRRHREIRRLVDHFDAGGTWASFDLATFPTKAKLRTRILKLFRNSGRSEGLQYAAPVDALNAGTIATLLSVTTPVATGIKNRAQAMIQMETDEAGLDADTGDDDGTE